MSLRDKAMMGLESGLRERFATATVEPVTEDATNVIRVNGVDEKVVEVARAVTDIVDGLRVVAMGNIIHEKLTDDHWEFMGILSDGTQKPATITITFIRMQSKLLVSLVWTARGSGMSLN